MTRYLTKSRFKLAYECPAKLYYNEQPDLYGNNNRENEFLKALADGGFQVGALAKLYYPGGIDLEELHGDAAIARTRELLEQERVTLFEAAIQHGPYLVRVDVLIKDRNHFSILEVKSKSYDSSDPPDFFKKRGGGINGDWESYLVDVSFQTWVTAQAYPHARISSFLLLPDKAARATVDGLHQNFRLLSRDERGAQVVVKEGLTLQSLGVPLLKAVQVDREVDHLTHVQKYATGETLPHFAAYLAEHHTQQVRGLAAVSTLCRSCEFRIDSGLKAKGLKSGFEHCWTTEGRLTARDLARPLIFDIWKLHHLKSQKLLDEGRVFLDQLTEDDLQPKAKSKKIKALEPYQRQWLQIEKTLDKDPAPYVDTDGLRDLFKGVTYPLHCIDFETSMAAIPFHKGRRPYEQIAFQFSHHVLHEDGRVAHVDQYLESRPGVFPNFDFVRRLRDSLATDQGTVFRYATHENTVLRQIRDQLQETREPDSAELIAFIDSITRPRKEEEGKPGLRCMVDLLELVLEHYYHPLMGGSNSIKKVIPAVLEESSLLRGKYAAAISSLNFDAMTWIEIGADGRVTDPYKRLPPVFGDVDRDVFEGEARLFRDEAIDDGGAAMTAWARMQFTEMSEAERRAIRDSLLKYCELDTLSMIWLLEYWRGLV